MRKRIKPLLMIVVVICLLIAMTACVADGNLKNAKGWGLDVNSPSDYRRPFAESDPNNPLDQKSDILDLSDFEYSYGRTIFITLSNSESINNLFYDYTPEDFGIEQKTYTIIHEDFDEPRTMEYPAYITSEVVFCDAENPESMVYMEIEELRERLRAGEKFDLSSCRREVRFDYTYFFKYAPYDINGDAPSEEEWMTMLENISKLEYVTSMDWAKGWF